MTLELMEYAAYASALGMGLVLGLLGAGGSILTVPIFVYLFRMPPSEATRVSLLVVGISAGIAMLGYLKKGLVLPKVAVSFFVPAYLGIVIARRGILPSLGDGPFKESLILVVFSLVMMAAALAMLRKPSASRLQSAQAPTRGPGSRLALQGFGVGIITGFVGAGGGFLIVPALVALAGLEMKLAVGTSLLIIMMNSLAGFLSSPASLSETPWVRLGVFVAIAVVGIAAGLRLSERIPSEKLKPLFGFFVLLMGSLILVSTVV